MSKVLRCFNCDDVILNLSPAEISDERWEFIEEWPSMARPCERMIRDGQFVCQSCLDYETKLAKNYGFCIMCNKPTSKPKQIPHVLAMEAEHRGIESLDYFDRLIYQGKVICEECYYGKKVAYVPCK